LKTAIVHDWLVTYSGAERVLEEIIRLYPEADLFSLLDFIPSGQRDFIQNKPVRTSFLQKFPLAKTRYRSFLPFMPLAVEQFDMSGYDLVISSSHAVAKGVITGPNQLHVCICYSPIRYAWDLTHHYIKEAGLSRGIKGWMAKYILHKIRMWDCRTANGVDEFVAISNFIAGRIMKAYRRDSTVIYPPVDTDAYTLHPAKEDFYLMVGRMVPYKNTGMVVEAFSKMPDKKLIVIGNGPDFAKVRRLAKSNVSLMGRQPFEVLKEHMQRARALIFAAEEDFGIVPIEAQACGTPIIACGRGGALETINEDHTGIFFRNLDISEIVRTVNRFEEIRDQFYPEEIRRNAMRFSTARFRDELKLFMDSTIESYFESRKSRPVAANRLKFIGKREAVEGRHLADGAIEEIIRKKSEEAVF
jgi:glycosyltransferase involved in cell wall biosynthesis